ncbi:MAG: CbiQ family ECF transporter T component [Sulfuritalea sp.]|nr:CbiQ family ECF transporter T component [Sulfuritalea sp.]
MKRPHPASLILLGLAVLLAASSRDGMVLFLGGLGLVLVALLAATSHLRLLLRRSCWLLLTMLVMFGWLTPGTPLPGVPGASQEGLLLAADNLARLIIALSTVALLLRALPPPELVAGMRSLLAPLALLNISRDRIAVRLALTLNEVEISRKGQSSESQRAATTLTLPASVFGVTDFVLGALAGALMLGAWLA